MFAYAVCAHVCISMFEHVKMNVLVQSQRFMVFTVIDNLVAKQREGMPDYLKLSTHPLTSCSS